MNMRTGLVLAFAALGAPALVLLDISVLYALVPAACAVNGTHVLQLLNASVFALIAIASLLAAREWRGTDRRAADDRAAFLAFVATCASLLSCLCMLATWIPQWVLDPCAS